MKHEFHVHYETFGNCDELIAEDKKLYDAAMKIREKAYAPYSRFFVGCAILLENGEIITANNQENAAYPSGLCAERAAIFWLGANYPNEKIKKIFVVAGPQDRVAETPAAPCGACRQSLLEYETKQDSDIQMYFASTEGKTVKCASIKDLLPFCFDKNDL